MLTEEEWLENIVGVVKHFADEEYQRSAWLGHGLSVSSPTEMYNELYEDVAFNLYRDQYGSSFSDAQRSAWLGFDQMLEKYGESLDEKVNPEAVLEDPAWLQVRRAADRFLQTFAAGH